MPWRGSTDTKDRLFAALVYLIPLFESLRFSGYIQAQFPLLSPLFGLLQTILTPLAIIYSINPFMSLIIFFVLLLAVVRNEKISHFIRFNTMQAILIDIALALLGIIFSTLFGSLGLVLGILSSIVFIFGAAACIYGIVQSVLGLYAEIPTISDAVYSQVP
ncbi:Tic20 family protein [Myxosarcina sp. GI1]|uniref:Tic20 family protein n=1 Tax=Myxosarcina sp. GI1 TaxID=1541065 RepID=UPI00056C9A8D|nr:Tic20 family protein [Myxosarcina sp. GI1]